MSSCDHSRNAPFLEMLLVGGTQIGENGIEHEGVGPGGSDGAGKRGQLEAEGSSGDAGAELSAGEAGVAGLSRRRSEGVAAMGTAGDARIARIRRSFARRCSSGCESGMRISVRPWPASTWRAKMGCGSLP